MQLPILSGIYTDEAGQFRTRYPRNLIPVPKSSGISEGYLRHTDGIIFLANITGKMRGAINWNGVLYAALDGNLCKIEENGNIITIGVIEDDYNPVTFDYSFTHLAVCSNKKFFLYDGTTFAQVTDTDLGDVLDFIWVDGYFMTTDGTSIVVTELNDPFSVNPLKYGSSEISPDPILAIKKVRNEPVAVNRYTMEFFGNVGGDTFPFTRITGAQIYKGAIGTHAVCVVNDLLVFVGSGQNEQPAVYSGINGNFSKLSTSEIEQELATYTESDLSKTVVEYKIYNGHIHVLIHLTNKTLIYDISASAATNTPIWYTADSGILETQQYRAKFHTYCYNKWIVGDTLKNQIGYLDDITSTHFGDEIGWEFTTQIVYNDGMGAIFKSLELIATTGRIELGKSPKISTSYSIDGITWSQEKFIDVGTKGNYIKRLMWFLQGSMRKMRIQRFKGTSDAMISIARLEANLEALYV